MNNPRDRQNQVSAQAIASLLNAPNISAAAAFLYHQNRAILPSELAKRLGCENDEAEKTLNQLLSLGLAEKLEGSDRIQLTGGRLHTGDSCEEKRTALVTDYLQSLQTAAQSIVASNQPILAVDTAMRIHPEKAKEFVQRLEHLIREFGDEEDSTGKVDYRVAALVFQCT
jgi:predicted transcriptional regulator